MRNTDDHVDEIEAQFAQADEDGDGRISLTEFRGLMLAHERGLRDAAVANRFLEIDTDRDGRIGLAEFRSWWLTDWR
jgi:Ca2+-binding EF-hand superfamily protein